MNSGKRKKCFVPALSIMILLVSGVMAWGDVEINETNFPNETFKNYVSSEYDTNSDGVLSDEEIASVMTIDVGGNGITSLKGIEYFTALTSLDCSSNQLTSLDVSKNTALTSMWCYGNQLTALDVSKNTALTYLDCGGNQLTELDVSKNTALESLYCYDNQLTTLDVSKNTALNTLWCSNNQLTTLDVSKNTALTQLQCYSNQLTTLDVSKNTALTELGCYSNQLTALDVSKNTALTYLHCSNNQLTISTASLDATGDSTYPYSLNLSLLALSVDVQEFVSRMNVTSVDVAYSVNATAGIVSFGATPRTMVYDYDTKRVNGATSMDVTVTFAGGAEPSPGGGNVAINETNFPDEYFRNYVSSNYDTNSDGVLTDAEIANVTLIHVDSCDIASLKGIEYFTALTNLSCLYNQLTELDLSRNIALTWVQFYNNQITEIDVSNNMALTHLDCGGNKLTTLDLKKNTALTELYFWQNQLTSLDLSNNTALTILHFGMNQITALDLRGCTALTELRCDNNQLAELDLSSNTDLNEIHCEHQAFTIESLNTNTSNTSYPYKLDINALKTSRDFTASVSEFISRVNNLTATDSNGNSVTCSLDDEDGAMYFTAWPKTIRYDYDTKNPSGTAVYMDVTITITGDVVPPAPSPENIIVIDAINFPDPNFRSYVSGTFDKDSNSYLSASEIASVKTMNASGLEISSLKGIEYFTELTSLSCIYNSITELDLSRNTKLTELWAMNNSISSIDVSKCTALKVIALHSNNLTALDVRNCTALVELHCGNNQLQSLLLGDKPALTQLYCYGNQLPILNVSGCPNLSTLDCDPQHIDLDSPDVTGDTDYPYSVSFSKLGITESNASEFISHVTNFSATDHYGRSITVEVVGSSSWKFSKKPKDIQYLYDVQKPGNTTTMYVHIELSGEADAPAIDPGYTPGSNDIAMDTTNFPDSNFRLHIIRNFDKDGNGYLDTSEMEAVTRINIGYDGITSLKGIEYFTKLQRLDCQGNNLTELDLSKNTALTTLYCYINQLTELDVSKNTALTYLDCDSNKLTELDVSKNTALTYLSCEGNQLTALDVSKNTALTTLYCSRNQLTELDVSKNTALTTLYCDSNKLTELDVSKNTALVTLSCSYNDLTALDVSKNTALTTLYCDNNQLTTLDISSNTALRSLYCYDNQLTALDVSSNTALTYLSCSSNQLSALNVSSNTALTYLYCYDNQLSALNVGSNTALRSLSCSSNQLTALDVSKNTALTDLYCYSNQLTELDVSKNTVLTELNCSNNTALKTLNCPNGRLRRLDISGNTALTELNCSGNRLTALNLSSNTSLQTLSCNSQAGSVSLERYSTASDRYEYWLSSLTNYNVSDTSFAANVQNMDVRDSNGNIVPYYINASSGRIYFLYEPKTIKYYYNVHFINDASASMDVAVTVGNESTPPVPPNPVDPVKPEESAPEESEPEDVSGITGISITSPAGKSVTLPFRGGEFTASITASGTVSGEITWSVSHDEALDVNITGNGNTASLSGTAQPNTGKEELSYSVIISAHDGNNVTFSDTLSIVLSVISEDEGITGVVLSSDTVNLQSSGGNFSVTASVTGKISGDLVWSVSHDEGIKAEISETGSNIAIKGTAPENTGSEDVSYNVIVYAHDNNNVNFSSGFTVIVRTYAPSIGITGISLSESSFNFDHNGGDFSVTASVEGNPSGDITWTVEADDDIAEPSGSGLSVTVSGKAPENTSATDDMSYTVKVSASDSITSKDASFTVTVAKKTGGRNDSDDDPYDPYDAPDVDGNSKETAYRLNSPEGFAVMIEHINSGLDSAGKHYMLEENIDLTGTNFQQIGSNGNPFMGHFDGNGHTIRYTHALGLFGVINSEGTAVENLNVVAVPPVVNNVRAGGESEPSSSAGGIVSELINGTIENCTFTGNVTAPSDDDNASAGGIAGMISGGAIQNCRVLDGSAIYASSFAGGIAGYISGGSISRCTSSADVNSDETEGYVGGIAGYSETEETRRSIRDNSFTGAELEVGNDSDFPPIPSNSGITGIEITSPDSENVSLSSSGGSFELIAASSGTPSGDVVWSVSFDSRITVNISSSDSNFAVISCSVPANSSTRSRSFNVSVSAHDNRNIDFSDSITITVSRGQSHVDPVRPIDLPSSVMRGILSAFPGMTESDLYYFSESEMSNNWEVSDNDLNTILGRNEQITLKLPRMMPSNTGVYIIRCVLSEATAGVNLKLYGIMDSSGGNLSSSALDNLEYKFFDENGNEIDTVPENKIVYAALRLNAGTNRGGVLTVPRELKTGTVIPVGPEDLGDDVLERIADAMSLDVDEIQFITDENITETTEPSETLRKQAKDRNLEFVGKMDTLTVEREGHYIVKVTLSDELYEQLKGVSVKNLRVCPLYNEENGTKSSSVGGAVLPGLLNTWEIFGLFGEKPDLTPQTFLMVGMLQAAEPLTIYILKTLLILLAGCDAGFGLGGIAALAVGMIAFMAFRKSKKH